MAGYEQRRRARPGHLAAALIVLGMGSCSTAPDGPPRAQGDICLIFDERPAWRVAVDAAASRWDVPAELVMAIIWKESGFRGEARPPKDYALGVIPWGRVSSAYGYAQAIDGTWDWYREETGNGWADRDDFEDAADFVGWYLDKTRAMNGVARHDAYSHYLAYHEGHTGFRRGSHRAKGWLLDAARRVAARAARYRGQLARCS